MNFLDYIFTVISNVPYNAQTYIVAYVDSSGCWWYVGDYMTRTAAEQAAKAWNGECGIFVNCGSPTYDRMA